MIGSAVMWRVSLLAVLAGCAGAAADAPLTVHLGATRTATAAALKAHAYCRTEPDGPLAKQETYPRCKRPGTEWGESWVTAVFDGGDTLVELRRWERFTDDARAVERWNQLIADRTKLAPASDDALAALRASGLLQPGTRAVKAFRDGADIVGVYLLTPSPPEDAAILERIVRAPR